MHKCLDDHIFKVIRDVAARERTPAYVIGGFVRDLLLNRESKDIDVVVAGNGITMAKKVAKAMNLKEGISIFKNFGTAMLRYGDKEIEFVGARRESYRKDSRKPAVEKGTLEDDQKRRDFTINALALSLIPGEYGKLIDPFRGLRDLEQHIIRTPLDPARTFSDDPLRMMRAIRFATQLQFRIDKKTFSAIRHNLHRIFIVSQERITDELNKIMLSAKPSAGFRLLEKSGLLAVILPELDQIKGVEEINGKKHKDNLDHTLRVLDNVAAKTGDLWLRYAALFHDVAKPLTKKFDPADGWTFHGHDFYGSKMIPVIFKRLKLPLDERMKYVQKLVLLHLRPISLSPGNVTDSAVRRLIFEAGDDLDDLMLLCEADITSKRERTVRQNLGNFRKVRKKISETEEKDAIRNFQPPVSGHLILETFGIKPSREVGIIKNAIKDAILDGIIPSDYSAAYRFMLEKGKELGLSLRDDAVRDKNRPPQANDH